MPAVFDTLKPMSFIGIPFPYKNYRIKGAIRKHIHEYPHSPGGALEKLGRSLYEVSVTVDFVAYDRPAKYGQLITDLGVLRGAFENQITGDLYIPHVGTIQACADEWTEDVVNTNRSTVKGELKFVEDQSSAFLVLETLQITGNSIAEKVDDYNVQVTRARDPVEMKLIGAEPMPDHDLFSKIDSAANALLSIRDQSDLYGALIVSKIDGLASLLGQADQQIKAMNEPPYWELREALHDLWSATLQIGRDVQNRDEFLKEYTVPLTMSVGQIASAVYGDSSRGVDVMQLNVLRDPLAVAAGTTIRYYQAA